MIFLAQNFSIIIVVLDVLHCNIYKGTYSVTSISYLNYPPPLLSYGQIIIWTYLDFILNLSKIVNFKNGLELVF
jgi:hypothetical protein